MNAHRMKMEMAAEIENFIDDKLAEFAAKTGLSCRATAQTCTTPSYDEDGGYEFAAVDLRQAFATWCHIEIASGSAGEFSGYAVKIHERDNGTSMDQSERQYYFEKKHAKIKASPTPPASFASPSHQPDR